MAKDKNGGAPSSTHNIEAMSDDQRRALVYHYKSEYEKALDAKKKADANFKNKCKIAVSMLGPDAVDEIKDLIKLETPEGEKEVEAEIRRKVRAAGYSNADFLKQGDLFGYAKKKVSQAFEHGKIAALRNHTRAVPSPFAGGQNEKDWYEGYDEMTAAKNYAIDKIINATPVEPAAVANEAPGATAAQAARAGEFDDAVDDDGDADDGAEPTQTFSQRLAENNKAGDAMASGKKH